MRRFAFCAFFEVRGDSIFREKILSLFVDPIPLIEFPPNLFHFDSHILMSQLLVFLT